MHSIIYFDMAAITVMLVLLFSYFFKKILFDNVSRIFLTFIVVVLGTAIVSLLTALYGEMPSSGDTLLRYSLHTLYLLLRNLNGPLYVFYILALTDTFHKYKNKLMMPYVFLLPYVLVVVGVVVNTFTKSVFFIDESGNYTRGDWFFILYLSGAFYMTFGIIAVYRNRSLLQFEQRISLYSLVALTVVALFIQWKYPHVMVEMLANSLSSILMLIMVQKPDDILDPLTNVKKRFVYAQEMSRNFQNVKPMDVIFINIANYNSLLAMLGFDRLNRLLQCVAKDLVKIHSTTRCYCDIYYVNSATFALSISGLLRSKTEQVLDEVCKIRDKCYEIDQMEVNAQIAVCFLQCPEDIEDYDSLMDISDSMRNYVGISNDIIRAKDIKRTNRFGLMDKLDEIIEDALVHRRFSVYYQPIYSVREKRFASAEALLRLWDDEYGYISPGVLIQAAEQSGSIHRIGDYVMEEVCRFVASREFESLGIDFIEVNLSVAQCMRKNLADSILHIMHKYKIDASRINLEITETAASFSQISMRENLEKLSQVGVQFSLDDYGVGYSNIERVVELPLQIVKLDKSFVDGSDNEKMWIALRNTVHMMKELHMKIVVEGVESEELVDKLNQLECDYIQGFYYSKPIPKKEFIQFIKQKQIG